MANNFPMPKTLAGNNFKDDTIKLRIDSNLKSDLNELVLAKHTTISDFLRQLIIEAIDRYHNEHKSDDVKSLVMKITHPEIDLNIRIDELEEKIKAFEKIVLKFVNSSEK